MSSFNHVKLLVHLKKIHCLPFRRHFFSLLYEETEDSSEHMTWSSVILEIFLLLSIIYSDSFLSIGFFFRSTTLLAADSSTASVVMLNSNSSLLISNIGYYCYEFRLSHVLELNTELLIICRQIILFVTVKLILTYNQIKNYAPVIYISLHSKSPIMEDVSI